MLVHTSVNVGSGAPDCNEHFGIARRAKSSRSEQLFANYIRAAVTQHAGKRAACTAQNAFNRRNVNLISWRIQASQVVRTGNLAEIITRPQDRATLESLSSGSIGALA